MNALRAEPYSYRAQHAKTPKTRFTICVVKTPKNRVFGGDFRPFAKNSKNPGVPSNGDFWSNSILSNLVNLPFFIRGGSSRIGKKPKNP